MAISQRDLKRIILILGAAVLAVAYFAFYRPTMTKNEALESENEVLTKRVETLREQIKQEEFYRSEITRCELEVDRVLIDFPSALLVENELMNIVDNEFFSDADIPSITISDPALVEVATSSSTSAPAALQYALYDMSTSISYTASYDGMKRLINAVADSSDRHSVTSFSATLDNSDGSITGVLNYEAYYISGQEKDYVAPDIPYISHGTENIFGSFDADTQQEEQEEQEEQEQEEQ